jgi:hypothetical protein
MLLPEVCPPLIEEQPLTKWPFLRSPEIEQIAALSTIVHHSRITVLEEPRCACESAEDHIRRVLVPHHWDTFHYLSPLRTLWHSF